MAEIRGGRRITEAEALALYRVKGWCPDSEVGWDVEGAVEIDDEEGEP